MLFNLTLEAMPEDGEELLHLCSTLNVLLGKEVETQEAKATIVSNVINFLTNLDGKPEPTSILFPADNMQNIQQILDFLLSKLEKNGPSSLLNLKVRVFIKKLIILVLLIVKC